MSRSAELYVPVHLDLPRHPKTLRAARLLGVEPPAVVGHLVVLWIWAAVYATDGDLTELDAFEVSQAAGWKGEDQPFVDALLACGGKGGPGFLERTDDGRLVLHDLGLYIDPLLSQREHNRKRQKAFRERKAKERAAELTRIAGPPNPSPKPPEPLPEATNNARNGYVAVTSALRNGSVEVSRGEVSRGEVNEEEISPSRGKSPAAASDPSAVPLRIPAGAELARVWNENRGPLPEVRLPLSAGREKHAKARLRSVPDLERWARAVQRVAASPFCRGENDRGWVADVDFLWRPDTLAKVEEGKYDPKGGPLPDPKRAAKLDEKEQARRREIERAHAEIRDAERIRREAGLPV